LLDLAQIEESGAELDTMRPGPPPMPNGFILPGSTRQMSDGTYVWAINRWVKSS